MVLHPAFPTGGEKKSFPQRRRNPHTRHLSPQPWSLSPSPTHGRAASLLGSSANLPFPLWQKTGCIQSPSEGACTPRLHALCVQPSPQSKSSSVLPPLPALQPNGGCPSVTAAAHDEFRCSEGRLRTGVGWVKGGGGRGNPTSSTTLSTFQRRWGPEGATCLTADLRPSQVPAPLTQPPPWAQVVPELRQCVGPAGGSG